MHIIVFRISYSTVQVYTVMSGSPPCTNKSITDLPPVWRDATRWTHELISSPPSNTIVLATLQIQREMSKWDSILHAVLFSAAVQSLTKAWEDKHFFALKLEEYESRCQVGFYRKGTPLSYPSTSNPSPSLSRTSEDDLRVWIDTHGKRNFFRRSGRRLWRAFWVNASALRWHQEWTTPCHGMDEKALWSTRGR